MQFIKTQLVMITILIHNILYNWLPFFYIKNLYLRLTGSRVGKDSYIHTRVRYTFPGRLSLGSNCTINFGCHLDTRGKLCIGDNVMVGHNCKFYTAGHDIDDDYFIGIARSINIEDNVVIFPNCLIMPGVNIAKNAVVLNGSVVTKDIAVGDVVGGNPAKFIKKRLCEPKYRLRYGYWFINS